MAIEAQGERTRRGHAGGGPRRPAVRRLGESGQASVSFVAVVPLILLLCMGGLQAALAGHASIAASHAASAAARAAYTGEDVDRAANAALPASLRESVNVKARGGVAEVKLSVPRVLPFGPRIPVESMARFGPGSEPSDG